MKNQFDTPWKTIFDHYFEDFMAYCFPQYYQKIDWTKGYKLLDKELPKVTRDTKSSNRVVDKLIEVSWKNGEKTAILLHVEVQAQHDPHFSKRMYTYYYRLRDRYQKPVISIALLIDSQEGWRPNTYHESIEDVSVTMTFPVIKLLDYEKRREELEQSNNPFATIILIQLEALKKNVPQNRLARKTHLTRELYKKNWKKEDIIRMLTFIDWVLVLPEALELNYKQTIYEIEEEYKVSYITSFEKVAMEKGEKSMLLRWLQAQFHQVPENYREKVLAADSETLSSWIERIPRSRSLEELFTEQ